MDYEFVEYYNYNVKIKDENSKYGFANLIGKPITPVIYDKITFFINGFSKTMIDGKYGFINSKMKEIVYPKYDWVEHFTEGYAVVKMDNAYSFINKKGIQVSLIYEYAVPFENGFALIKKFGNYGVLDKNFNEYMFEVYEDAEVKVFFTKYNDTYIINTRNFIGTLSEFKEFIEKRNRNDMFVNSFNKFFIKINEQKYINKEFKVAI